MPDNVVDVAKRINAISEAIKMEGQRSEDLIKAEAESMRNYDREIAIRELAHRAADMPVTLIQHQAKGDACDLLYEMIVAQKTLKAHWERFKYLEAQMNAQQSIYKHLSHT